MACIAKVEERQLSECVQFLTAKTAHIQKAGKCSSGARSYGLMIDGLRVIKSFLANIIVCKVYWKIL